MEGTVPPSTVQAAPATLDAGRAEEDDHRGDLVLGAHAAERSLRACGGEHLLAGAPAAVGDLVGEAPRGGPQRVSTGPGVTALTSTPVASNVSANRRDRESWAALVTE